MPPPKKEMLLSRGGKWNKYVAAPAPSGRNTEQKVGVKRDFRDVRVSTGVSQNHLEPLPVYLSR